MPRVHGAPGAAGSQPPLYRPEQEHDACGVGFVATLSGPPSQAVLRLALEGLANLTHRGAVSADGRTGDGAGVLFQVPARLFAEEAVRLGWTGVPDRIAVGMVFLPSEAEPAGCCRQALEGAVRSRGLEPIGWREVPVRRDALGERAAATAPRIEQLLVPAPPAMEGDELERRLYLARREAERWALEHGAQDFYVVSLSHRTLVYKGLFVAHQLAAFYEDLSHPLFETRLAVLHQRYSTNTFPNWRLAQPFRMLAHNGEINTLQGNESWMRAREPDLCSELWGAQVRELVPVVQPGGSDSAALDNVLECLALSGRDLAQALRVLVPEAWESMPDMPLPLRQLHEYHACLSEPWDGPAALAFSDGRIVGAALDRNGLRPARFAVTADGLVVLASEVGLVPLDPRSVVRKGRLGPGQMLAVDTETGALLTNEEIEGAALFRQPYGAWLDANLVRLPRELDGDPRAQENGAARELGGNPRAAENGSDPADLVRRQVLFGYTREEIALVLEPMVKNAAEAVGSMGDDTALAVLSEHSRLLYHYFKQKFAQVTNPPIDSIREKLVTSLDVYLGRRRSLLEETPEHARLVHVAGPILTAGDVRALLETGKRVSLLDATFPGDEGAEGLEPALERLAVQAEAAIDAGAEILILSDRAAGADRAPIPMLAAVGAVHHALIRRGKRMRASLVAETGEAREVHQLACLVGFGAAAIHPHLVLETLADLHRKGDLEGLSLEEVLERYVTAAETGLLKIMSKMGISTLSAYHGAQIFEAVGLGPEVTERCFAGTPSRVGGIGFRQIGEELFARQRAAFSGDAILPEGGFFRFRRDGEPHSFSPAVAKALFKAAETGDRADYAAYLALSHVQPPAALRDLLRFRSTRPPVDVDEVEPIEAIMARFTTGAMSLGALSPEAHETLAVAMNRMGGKSNTGEGGEDPRRFRPADPERSANSAIKQVASGRFGVTPAYLAHAQELEIKMAQGSKPGEGGQLPGHKVSAYIARLRHTLPGTPLVSPPPHHDIYSIEDLAQLIYDLKQANPRARVSVKLVAEEGVGTIAAGVAKGYADVIHISGHEGGTGASPLSSVKHAGLPWELGLAEAQQVLVMNNLRDRVRLRTDGGLKSGRDVLVAALLGAEEYAFGTAALIALGCRMARQCHLNTCPVGIATQREDLRAKFSGTPDHVWNLFVHVAFEVRELLAEMGFKSLHEVIGRMDLLEPDDRAGRAAMLDLRALMWMPEDDRPLHSSLGRNLPPAESFDDRVLPEVRAALDSGVFLAIARRVGNVDRSIGARISGEIALRYGTAGLPPGTLELELEGSAGQSLGAFLAPGIRILLAGEANDYVGKGMAGGEIVIQPPAGAPFAAHENVIVGNTVLYGATGGSLFVAGRAGERFAVRNSGARAVVEGVGDHGCEYMTQGVVVVLGEAGRNFASGMSNGVAYVLDEFGEFARRVQDSAVGLERLAGGTDEELLLALVERHALLTGSSRAQAVLSRWKHFRPRFWKVAPRAALAEETHESLVRDHLSELRATSLERAVETGVGG